MIYFFVVWTVRWDGYAAVADLFHNGVCAGAQCRLERLFALDLPDLRQFRNGRKNKAVGSAGQSVIGIRVPAFARHSRFAVFPTESVWSVCSQFIPRVLGKSRSCVVVSFVAQNSSICVDVRARQHVSKSVVDREEGAVFSSFFYCCSICRDGGSL